MKLYRNYRYAILLSLILSAEGFQQITTRSTRVSFARNNRHISNPSGYCRACVDNVHVRSAPRPTVLFSQTPTKTEEEIQGKTALDSSIVESSANTKTNDNDSSLLDNESPFAVYVPILALCWFVALLSALDRVAMSVAILPLASEYHLSDTVKGEISSIFSLGYGLCIVPMGLLVSSVSPRLLMASGVALWSLATLGTPIAASLIMMSENVVATGEAGATLAYVVENTAPLLAMRAVMGGAESVVLPTIQRILANWVPAARKSLAVATVLSGFQIGTVCAYLLSPYVMEIMGGWRELFYVYGAIGALWLVPWLLFAKDYPDKVTSVVGTVDEGVPVLMNTMKEDDASLTMENQLIDTNGKPVVIAEEEPLSKTWEEATSVLKDAPWKEMFQSKAVWGLTIAHAANNWGLYNSLSWTPTFYNQQYGLNVKESAFLSVLPSIAGAICGLAAGALADKVIESMYNGDDEDIIEKKTKIRRAFQGIALLGPAVCLATLASHIPEDPLTAQTLLTGTVGLQAFNAAGYSAGPQEKAGEKWGGLLYSITTLPGVMFGSLGVYVTGKTVTLVKNFDSSKAVFVSRIIRLAAFLLQF